MKFFKLNEQGKEQVRNMVEFFAKAPEEHDMEWWYARAEDKANGASHEPIEPGGNVLIEISGQDTKSGNPEVFRVEYDEFDTVGQDDDDE